MLAAVGWVVLITCAEGISRRLIKSRAKAWLAAYAALLIVCFATGLGLASKETNSAFVLLAGITLSLCGYQFGRALLKDKATAEPQDSLLLDFASVGLLIPIVEEFTWGAHVEPSLGILITGLLFSAKHVVIDRRWQRGLGLAGFWWGLGLVRAFTPVGALVLHVFLNVTGVLIGHKKKLDQF